MYPIFTLSDYPLASSEWKIYSTQVDSVATDYGVCIRKTPHLLFATFTAFIAFFV